MPRTKTAYRCTDCGADHAKWQGRCDSCGEWNTLVEELLPPKVAAGATARRVAGARGLAGVILKPDDEQLATAAVGVTEAFAGIASTGSVCVSLGRPLVGATSLLMPLNIVLLASERIVERPRDLFLPEALKGEALKRNLVVITGPSATADMGPLVRGVHGPHRLLILLLE